MVFYQTWEKAFLKCVQSNRQTYPHMDRDETIKLNHHLYYCSRGLERPMVVARGKLGRKIENPDFQNDYVTTKNFSNPDEALSYIEPLEV